MRDKEARTERDREKERKKEGEREGERENEDQSHICFESLFLTQLSGTFFPFTAFFFCIHVGFIFYPIQLFISSL